MQARRYLPAFLDAPMASAIDPYHGHQEVKPRKITTIAPKLPKTDVKPGIDGFVELAEAVGLNLEPFQRRIVKAALGPERELRLPR